MAPGRRSEYSSDTAKENDTEALCQAIPASCALVLDSDHLCLCSRTRALPSLIGLKRAENTVNPG